MKGPGDLSNAKESSVPDSVYDPFTFIVVPLLLCLVALVAILIPARAGMRVDPDVGLRNE